MTGEWRQVKVENIARRAATGPFGSSISSKHFLPAGVPVIRGSNLSQDIGLRLVDEGMVFLAEDKASEFSRSAAYRGDLVFTCWGTIDQVGLIDKSSRYSRYIVSNKQMLLSPDEAVADSLFLYYLFSSPRIRSEILNRGIGSSVPGFNLGQLRSFELLLPPLSEQRAIAHILGMLDDKIELNRRRNQTLEAMARALFKDWFVDFGPVRAKMEGREPYLPADLWQLFPDRLDDEGKPEGWDVAALRDVTTVLRRGISPSYLESGGVRVLNQKCIRNREINLGPARRHNPSKRQVEGRTIIAGDILVNSTGVGTLGRTAQLWRIDEPTVVDSHVSVVRPDTDIVRTCYLGLNLTGREAEIELLGEGSTGQTELSRVRLGSLPVLVPPQQILDQFDSKARPLLEAIFANTEECAVLAQLRDTLLPKLISGDLRIADAARFIEEGAV